MNIKFIIGQYVDRKDLNGLADFFSAHLEDEILDKEKLLDEIKNISYDGKDKPTLEDETLALTYESNAEAFFAGFDEGIKKALEIINHKK